MKKSGKMKRLLGVLLSVLMIGSCLQVAAFAAEDSLAEETSEWAEETSGWEGESAEDEEAADLYEAAVVLSSVVTYAGDEECEHDWVATTVKEPTCEEGGVQGLVCSKCGAAKRNDLAPLGHTEEVVPGYAATCAAEGLTDGVKCSVCGKVLEEQTVIPKSEEHSWGEPVVVVAATCTKGGVNALTCEVCGAAKRVNTEALGHTEEVVPGYAATCKAEGLTDGKVCSVCGEVLEEQTVIPKTEHSWGEPVVIVAATCTKGGVNALTCEVCGAAKRVNTEALGHTEEVVPGYAATCTEDGLTDGKECSVCGEVLEEQNVIPAAHTLGEAMKENEKAATCTESGSYEEVVICTVCGQEISREQVTIPAAGHDLTLVPEKEATAKEEGNNAYYVCSVCGNMYEDATALIPTDEESVKIPVIETEDPTITETPKEDDTNKDDANKDDTSDKDTSDKTTTSDKTSTADKSSASVKASGSTSNGTASGGKTSPKTDDPTNAGLYLAVLMLSASAAGLLLKRKRAM